MSRLILTNQSEGTGSASQEQHQYHPTVSEQLPSPPLGLSDGVATDAIDKNVCSQPGNAYAVSQSSNHNPGNVPEDSVPLEILDVAQDPASGIDNIDSWAWVHESIYLQPDDFLPLAGQITAHDARYSVAAEAYGQVISHHGVPSEQHGLASNVPHASVWRGSVQGPPHPTLPSEVSLALQRNIVIDDLTTYAVAGFSNPFTSNRHGEYWSSKSTMICESFNIDLSPQQTAMKHFMDLYLMHFWPLWPVLAKQELDIDTLHPLLCLVLVSVGAMYGGSGSVTFGSMMHNKTRTFLTMGFELDHDDEDFTWLAQARLYTQVAALYFGQARAFTYAQHLGALLIAQARRMGLYSADLYERAHQNFELLKSTRRSHERLAIWLQLEGRRRLAFGVFRADTYTSVLLDTPPLLSMEELDVTLPSCDAVWRADAMPVDACLHMIDHDRSPCRKLRASALYHIALEPEEPLPVLEPVAHEILQFGLQNPLGRYRYGHSPLPHWTGSSGCNSSQEISNSSIPAVAGATQSSFAISRESKSLSTPTRTMSRLAQEYRHVLQSQVKWEGALQVVKTFLTNENDRGSLMSGLVLFHLGHLRLHAPISELHQLQYNLSVQKSLEASPTALLKEWTTSSSARLAAQHSCSLFSLVASEVDKEGSNRVKFNLLAFIGLHHAAVILWSYMGSSGSISPSDANNMHIELPDHTTLAICERNSKEVMQAFVDLLYRISPGSWSSFAEAAALLVSAAVSWKPDG